MPLAGPRAGQSWGSLDGVERQRRRACQTHAAADEPRPKRRRSGDDNFSVTGSFGTAGGLVMESVPDIGSPDVLRVSFVTQRVYRPQRGRPVRGVDAGEYADNKGDAESQRHRVARHRRLYPVDPEARPDESGSRGPRLLR